MKGVRKNLIQPPDWWAAFEAAAEKAGCSLAEWMGKTCRAALPKSVQSKLSERPEIGRPKTILQNPKKSV